MRQIDVFDAQERKYVKQFLGMDKKVQKTGVCTHDSFFFVFLASNSQTSLNDQGICMNLCFLETKEKSMLLVAGYESGHVVIWDYLQSHAVATWKPHSEPGK